MYNLVSRVHLVHFTLVHLLLLPSYNFCCCTAKRANVFSLYITKCRTLLKAFSTLTWVITKCESELALQVKHSCFPILLIICLSTSKRANVFRFALDVERF